MLPPLPPPPALQFPARLHNSSRRTGVVSVRSISTPAVVGSTCPWAPGWEGGGGEQASAPTVVFENIKIEENTPDIDKAIENSLN
jgi:hypothetical protein